MVEGFEVPDPVPRDPAAVQQTIDEITTALDGQQLLVAERRAEEALREMPDSAAMRALYGYTLTMRSRESTPPELGLLRRGEGELLRARKVSATDPTAAAVHARFLADEGHWSAAVDVAETALQVHADDELLLQAAADAAFELGEERRARPHLRKLAEQRPRDAVVRYRLGWIELQLAESAIASPFPSADRTAAREAIDAGLASAHESFSAAVALDSADFEALLGLGRTLYVRAERFPVSVEENAPNAARTEAFRESLAVYRKSRRMDAGRPEGWFAEGLIHLRLDAPRQAAEAFQAALAVDPTHLPSLLEAAHLAVQQGEGVDARALYTRALASQSLPELTRGERRAIETWLAAEMPSSASEAK